MRIRSNLGVAAFFAVALASLLGGCDAEGVSSSLDEATVTGLVTFKGKPITTGKVSFNAANSARRDVAARLADIGPDGRYTVKALIGGNQVSLQIPNMMKMGADPLRAGKVVQVTKGENTCDLDMPQFRPPPQP